MILTGKAKEDFLEYYNNHSIKYLLSWTDFDDLPLVVKNALIIEWLDSVGIYINTTYEEFEDIQVKKLPVLVKTWIVWVNEELLIDFNSRQEATDEAIKKANEIYNNL